MTQHDNDQPSTANDDQPLYRFSWRRFFVVGTALLTLPIWAPRVKEHSGLQTLLVLPFILVFVVSLIYVAKAFPSKAVRERNRRNR